MSARHPVATGLGEHHSPTVDPGGLAASQRHGTVFDGRFAGVAHAALLGVAAGVLLFCARGQFFFLDEWRFLSYQEIGPFFGLLHPYNGHWSTVPMVVYRILRAVVGTSSYWPYIGTLIAVHLALVHVSWRVMCRLGTTPWVATLLAALFSVAAAGLDNLVWAFQIGFVGSLLAGMVTVLLSVVPRVGPARLAAVTGLLVLNLATSGVGLVFVVVVPLVLALRSRAAALVAGAVPLASYAGWYAAVDHPVGTATLGVSPTVPGALSTLAAGLAQVPLAFLGVAPVNGSGLGLLLMVPAWAATVWVVTDAVHAARGRTSGSAEVLVIAVGGVAFLAMTALVRYSAAVLAGPPSRYVYVLVCLALPLWGFVLTRWVWSPRLARHAMGVLVVLVAVNAALLPVLAGQWRTLVHASDGGLASAARVVAAGGGYPDARPFPYTVSEVTRWDLVQWHRRGMTPGWPVTPSDELSGQLMVNLRAVPVARPVTACRAMGSGEWIRTVAKPGEVAQVVVSEPALAVFRLVGIDGARSTNHPVPLPVWGAYSFETRIDRGTLELSVVPTNAGRWELCSEGTTRLPRPAARSGVGLPSGPPVEWATAGAGDTPLS